MAQTLVERVRGYAGDEKQGDPILEDADYQALIDNLSDAEGNISAGLLYLAAAQALEKQLQVRVHSPGIRRQKLDLIQQYRSQGYGWQDYGPLGIAWQGRQHAFSGTPTGGMPSVSGGQVPAAGGGITEQTLTDRIARHNELATAHTDLIVDPDNLSGGGNLDVQSSWIGRLLRIGNTGCWRSCCPNRNRVHHRARSWKRVCPTLSG